MELIQYTPFTPKNNVEEYLHDSCNKHIKAVFKEDADIKFFNTLYHHYEVIERNKHNPPTVIKHFNSVEEEIPFGNYEAIEVYFFNKGRFWDCLFYLLSIKMGEPKSDSFDYRIALIFKLLHAEFIHHSESFISGHFQYFFTNPTSYVDNYLTNDFNIAVFYDIKQNFGYSYEPLDFLNLLYDSIEITKYLVNRPSLLYQVLTSTSKSDSTEDIRIKKNYLIFWLLVAIRNRIGFYEWCKGKPEIENALNVAFTFLNRAYDEEYPLGPNVLAPINTYNNKGFKIEEKEHLELEASGMGTDIDAFSFPNFKLSQSKRGTKTDLIRVLNALYELRFIETPDGQIPTKADFMQHAGVFFGIDLTKYETDLSQALRNTSLEANLKIFQDMQKIIQTKHYEAKE